MKPSHFSTPRMLNEATFWLGGDAIERPMRRQTGFWRWATFSLLAMLALSFIAGRG